MKPAARRPPPPKSVPPQSALPDWIAPAAILAALAALLPIARDSAPPGINNDVAEEALRGLLLLDRGSFEVITFSIGNSAETLYLYLLGAAARVFGTTTFAVQAVSWAFALGCVWLTWKLAGRILDTVPRWLPLLAGAASLWLFHYARTGLRAISAPFFLAAFALLLDRAEERIGDRRAGLACGAILGLSIYAYTSTRVLPIAFAVYVLVRLVRLPECRAALARCYGWIAAGAAVVSIPNLVFLARRPAEFLTRGSYSLQGGAVDQVFNVFWSAVFPFYYPDYYRNIAGPTFFFDGVSAALTASGRNPVHVLFGLAMLVGVWRLRDWVAKPAGSYLAAVWTVSVALLGLGGPSLTRMLILWPVCVVAATAGFAWMMSRTPSARLAFLLPIAAVGLFDCYSYLVKFGDSPAAIHFYGAAATPIGARADEIAAGGRRVACIVAKDAGIVRYMTHYRSAAVKVVEGGTGLGDFQADILLIEKAPQFTAHIATFPAGAKQSADRYEEIRLR